MEQTDDFYGEAPLPDEPTYYPPGTREKLLVMENRRASKQQLFHPFDAIETGDTRPLKWFKMSQEERKAATRVPATVLEAAKGASRFWGNPV